MSKKEVEEKELKVSFFSKKEYTCPVCREVFHKEELLSGGGRLIAGTLTLELHRLYEPSVKYGKVYPLIYQAVVCPECWFASMEADFDQLPPVGIERAMLDQARRKADTRLLFPHVDFTEPRGLAEGAASQYLVLRCYGFYDTKHISPTIKQGLTSLRTAWIFDDLDKSFPGQHYDWLATLFRKKAQYFYNEALIREQSGIEAMSGLKFYGPDLDKNYAYEGMLYLCAYLRYKYGPSHNAEERKSSLEDARRIIAKLFGMGRKSKDKPGAFLDLVRKLYDTINKELGTAADA
ncbi:MAG: DUF2225 domain-containing protein [Treponema sp.]|jgi:uncharacterized protein (DUF2225 family)|nr:DUF2225 domain-containing protein [Treponema sp.]